MCAAKGSGQSACRALPKGRRKREWGSLFLRATRHQQQRVCVRKRINGTLALSAQLWFCFFFSLRCIMIRTFKERDKQSESCSNKVEAWGATGETAWRCRFADVEGGSSTVAIVVVDERQQGSNRTMSLQEWATVGTMWVASKEAPKYLSEVQDNRLMLNEKVDLGTGKNKVLKECLRMSLVMLDLLRRLRILSHLLIWTGEEDLWVTSARTALAFTCVSKTTAAFSGSSTKSKLLTLRNPT